MSLLNSMFRMLVALMLVIGTMSMVACEDEGDDEAIIDTSDTSDNQEVGPDFEAMGMVWVPMAAGSFDMGQAEPSLDLTQGDTDPAVIAEWGDVRIATPIHEVTLPAFEILKTEVTVAQYKACVDADLDEDGNPDCEPILLPRCADAACENPLDVGCGNIETNNYWTNENAIEDRSDHPVNCIYFEVAKNYCEWLGGRLPSESEWEYAARSQGANALYPWGNADPTCDVAVLDERMTFPAVADPVHTVVEADTDTTDTDDTSVLDFLGCGTGTTAPVCSKVAGNTADGLCDMIGNVYELTEDCWHHTYDEDRDGTADSGDELPTDGSAWTDASTGDGTCGAMPFLGDENARVIKGGSYYGLVPSHFNIEYRYTASTRGWSYDDWHEGLPKEFEVMFQWGSQYGFRCVRDAQ